MNLLLSPLSGMPKPVQAGVMVATGGGILGALGLLATGYTPLAITILVCIAALATLLLAYRAFLNWRQKVKANPFLRDISQSASAVPQGVGEAASRARLDDLRKKFEKGLSTFRAHGKNIYALPWYIMVGEPGSGKTEAIRHCNIGFPPGLQDELQGVGGTVNMDWWFTDHAVILDTAGRLILEDVDSSATSEWKEFLKLLAKHRPNCPVNGLLLAIPADSLIRDSADAIERKAGKIARQLDHIQRTLGVRFPVFVVVTKADLINGFREFFDDIIEPQLQHQMLGWSNPAQLDEEFKPEHVDRYLGEIRSRLSKRRYALLRDPIHTEDENGRRIDQVDSLFAFPDGLMIVAPRLRWYLEKIFVGGTWATKPLFLRGIYFTSSMREGDELDEELAKLHGVAVESLPSGATWTRDKAYFLRDVFLNKIFRERGLVTRASNTKKLQQRRRATFLGAGVLGTLLFCAFTIWGILQVQRAVRDPAEFWDQTRRFYLADTAGDDWRRVIFERQSQRQQPYRGIAAPSGGFAPETWWFGQRKNDYAGAALAVFDESQRRLPIPFIFRLTSGRSEIAYDDRQRAAASVLAHSVLEDAVAGARRHIQQEDDWNQHSIQVLADLIWIDEGGIAPSGIPIHVESLVRYNQNDPTSEEAAQISQLQEAINTLYGRGDGQHGMPWPPRLPAFTNTTQAVDKGIERLNSHLKSVEASGIHGELNELIQAIQEFASAERELHDLTGPLRGSAPDKVLADWHAKFDALSARLDTVSRLREKLDGMGLVEANRSRLKTFIAALKPVEEALSNQSLVDVQKLAGIERTPTAREDLAKCIANLKVNDSSELARTLLAQLETNYLSNTSSGEPHYQARFAMYQQAHALMQERQDITDGDPWLLSHSIGQVGEAYRKAREFADSRHRSLRPADLEVNKNSMPAAEAALDVAHRLQRQFAMERFVAALPESPQTLKDKIKQQSPREVPDVPPVIADLRLPSIALSRSEDPAMAEIGREYCPRRASNLLASWKEVENAIRAVSDEKAAAQSVIDARKLSELLKNKHAHVVEYVNDYKRFWTRDVRDRISPKLDDPAKYKSWDDLIGKVRGMPAINDLNDSLFKVSKAIEFALDSKQLPDSFADDDIKRALAMAKDELIDLRNSDYRAECRDAWNSWRQLDKVQIAQAKIIAASEDIRNTYMRLYHGLNPNLNEKVSSDYWSQWSLAMLERVAHYSREDIRSACADLCSSYERFPLCWVNASGLASPPAELSLDDLQRARDIFVSLQSLATEAPATQPNHEIDLGPEWREVSALLRRLQGQGVLDGADLAVIKKLHTVFQIFEWKQNRPELVCEVTAAAAVGDMPTFYIGNAGLEGAALNVFPYYDIRIAGEAASSPAFTEQQKADKAISIGRHADVELRFYTNPGEPARGSAKLPSPWTVLGLLYRVAPKYITFSEDRREVTIPVVVEAEGKRYWWYPKFSFARPIPAIDDWPTVEDWKRLRKLSQ